MFRDKTIMIVFACLCFFLPTILYAAPGDFDTSFSGDGVVTYSQELSGGGEAVAIQPDGKIVVAGGIWLNSALNVLVLRYNSNGALDMSFGGGDGVVTYNRGRIDCGHAVAIQPDGKIVVAGESRRSTGTGIDLLIMRYNSDGTPDTSFGSNGIVTYNGGLSEAIARAIAIQPDGKIVVAGSNNLNILLLRCNSNGTLDKSFSGDGVVTYNYDGPPYGYGARAVAIQPDGKIVVVSKKWNGIDDDVLVLRYTSSGKLDNSFSRDGVITYNHSEGDYDCGSFGHAVAIQPDGKIVIVGEFGCVVPNPEIPNDSIVRKDISVLRYTSNGTLDKSFSGDGVVTYDYNPAFYDFGRAVAVQPDGKIVIAGSGGGDYGDVVVLRYNSNGTFDSSFGRGDGVVTYEGGGWGNAVAIQPDGKIVVAGTSINNDDTGSELLVLRLIGLPPAEGCVVVIDGMHIASIVIPDYPDDFSHYLRDSINAYWSGLIENKVGEIDYFAWSRNIYDTEETVAKLSPILEGLTILTKKANSPLVILSHSWGTVLAYLAVSQNSNIYVDKFISLGSPLNAQSQTAKDITESYVGEVRPLSNVKIWDNYWANCDKISGKIDSANHNAQIKTDYIDNIFGTCHAAYYEDYNVWQKILLEVYSTGTK